MQVLLVGHFAGIWSGDTMQVFLAVHNCRCLEWGHCRYLEWEIMQEFWVGTLYRYLEWNIMQVFGVEHYAGVWSGDTVQVFGVGHYAGVLGWT